ncbi:MAG: MotA/TolQ/ExbB proton channel family protein [Myxococcaceae bacterium]|nr:MotA/TolQ/ExbB proton channel family protein [Myxococcaceae bacterium]
MFDLEKIIGHMGPFAMAIAVALMVMGVAALAVFLERMVMYARSRYRSRRFAAKARAMLERDEREPLMKEAAATRGSWLAALLGKGLETYSKAEKAGSTTLSPVEATRRELERQTEALDADVRRGHSVLASVGSVAPFVGLLGTVVGIIDAFQGIAKEGSGGLGAVSLGIAEALVVTALGLLVAIPAVLAHNWLTTQAEGIGRALDQARGELLDFLEARGGKTA